MKFHPIRINQQPAYDALCPEWKLKETPPPRERLSLETDHPDGTCKCGETVRFSIEFLRDGKPVPGRKLHCRIQRDFHPDEERDLLSGDEPVFVETTLERPGFVRLSVTSDALTAARGVDVRIIVPANNDHFFVSWAAQNYYSTLLENGVKIYNKQGVFSHIKALLADGTWGFMGSSNCDSRSFRLNFELDFCFEQSPFPGVLRDQFLEELANSLPVTLEQERAKSFPRRLGENICALFTPIL